MTLDATYQPKVYRKQGGDILVIASGGQIKVESGGEVLVESGGYFTIESGGYITAESGGKFKLESGGYLDAESGSYLNLQSGSYAYLSAAGFSFRQGTTNKILDIVGVSSQVNGLCVTGSIAGAAVHISTAGSDTDVNLDIEPKGNGMLRINSVNKAATSGDIIGYQSKPAGNGTGTATVYGSQISPRFNHGVAGADLVGVQSNPILKGTAAAGGNLTGDVRCFEARLESEAAGVRTVAGGLFGIRFMNQLYSTITATGGVYPIKVDTHSNTLAWSGLMKLPSDGNIAKYSAGHYGTIGTLDGAIQVMIGSTALWIPAYTALTA
jgi:hypothetical protein